MLIIQRASGAHIDKVVRLFDAYRNFYGQKSDIEAAKTFLTERLANNESIVLVAYMEDTAIGFTQLYTTFSSVGLRRFYILNDLYVDPKFRNRGVAANLLEEAKNLCQKMKYKGLALETAKENPAQQLYEKLGWKKDADYLHYFWTNPAGNH